MASLTSNAYIFIGTGSLGIIANVTQLILFCRDKNRNRSPFGLTLLSLNAADVLASIAICLLGITHFAVLVDSALFKSLKQVVTSALAFSLLSSITHIAFIAIQRVMAVARPLKVKRIITKSRCYIILALMWIVSVALAIAVLFAYKQGFMVLGGMGIAIGIALMVLYSVIYYKTKKRNSFDNTNGDMQRRRRQSEREVLKYSVAVTAVFVVCNYPKGLDHFIKFPLCLQITFNFLFSINPLLDTLLYFLISYCKRRRERNRAKPASIVCMQMRGCVEMPRL